MYNILFEGKTLCIQQLYVSIKLINLFNQQRVWFKSIGIWLGFLNSKMSIKNFLFLVQQTLGKMNLSRKDMMFCTCKLTFSGVLTCLSSPSSSLQKQMLRADWKSNLKNVWTLVIVIFAIWILHGKCIQMSANKPSIGPVVLEITFYDLRKSKL